MALWPGICSTGAFSWWQPSTFPNGPSRSPCHHFGISRRSPAYRRARPRKHELAPVSLFQADAPHAVNAPGKGVPGRFSGRSIVVPCMKEHWLFVAICSIVATMKWPRMPFQVFLVRTAPESGAAALECRYFTRHAEALHLRCSFLESLAALPGKHAAYLQEEQARSSAEGAEEATPPSNFLRAGAGFSSARPKETRDKKRLSRNHLQKSLCFRNVSVVLSIM